MRQHLYGPDIADAPYLNEFREAFGLSMDVASRMEDDPSWARQVGVLDSMPDEEKGLLQYVICRGKYDHLPRRLRNRALGLTNVGELEEGEVIEEEADDSDEEEADVPDEEEVDDAISGAIPADFSPAEEERIVSEGLPGTFITWDNPTAGERFVDALIQVLILQNSKPTKEEVNANKVDEGEVIFDENGLEEGEVIE